MCIMTDGTPLFPKAPPRDVSHAYFVDVWNPGFLFFWERSCVFSFLVEQKRMLKQMKLKTWPFSSGDGTKDFFLTVTKNHKSERGVGK